MTEQFRVAHRVLRDADRVDAVDDRLRALLTVLPATTVFAGWTAARLHRLWLPPWPAGRTEMIIHPEVPRGIDRARSRRPEVRARRQVLLEDETVEVDGIPVTSAARTWLDLADRLPMPDLVALGDSVLRSSTSRAELVQVVSRAVHRRGVVRARQAMELLDERSRSRPESHLRYALHAAGLPAPAVNAPIYSAQGEWLGEPDLSYDDVRLAIEYNGAGHADVDRLRRDITRRLDIEARGGWQMVVFGPAEVLHHPDRAVIQVRRLRHLLAAQPRLSSTWTA